MGIHKGNTGLAQQINAAIKEMVSSGAWQKAIEDNTRGTGFSPDKEYNPPKATEGEGK